MEKKQQPKTPSLWIAWIIWLCSALFVLFQFFLQLSSGVIVEDLMRSFSLNALGAGILSSTYYYVYVLLQTPAGVLIDRYGPRLLLSVGAFVCALGCWFFAIAHQVYLAEFGRILMGAGSSFAFVGSLFLISQWFAPNRFAYMVGVAETIGTLGVLAGDIFLAIILQTYGWRRCMLGATAIAILLAILSVLIIRNRPKSARLDFTSGQKIETIHFWRNAVLLLKDSQAWINGIYSGLQFSVVTVFVALWGIPFFIKAQGMSLQMATIITSMVFVGLAIGCPIVGALTEHIKDRRFFLCLCALFNAFLLAIIIYFPQISYTALAVLMFFVGILCSSYVLNFAIANEIAPSNGKSTCIGFTNTLSVITAPLLQPIVGAILNLSKQHKGINTLTDYSLFDYKVALTVLPITLIVAAVLAYFLDGTKVKIENNENYMLQAKLNEMK